MDVRANLKAYLDGEVTPAEAKELEDQLLLDPELYAELEQLRSLGVALTAMKLDHPVIGAEATTEALLEGATREVDLGERKSNPVVGYIVGLCVAAAIVAIFSLLPKTSTDKSAAERFSELQRQGKVAGAVVLDSKQSQAASVPRPGGGNATPMNQTLAAPDGVSAGRMGAGGGGRMFSRPPTTSRFVNPANPDASGSGIGRPPLPGDSLSPRPNAPSAVGPPVVGNRSIGSKVVTSAPGASKGFPGFGAGAPPTQSTEERVDMLERRVNELEKANAELRARNALIGGGFGGGSGRSLGGGAQPLAGDIPVLPQVIRPEDAAAGAPGGMPKFGLRSQSVMAASTERVADSPDTLAAVLRLAKSLGAKSILRSKLGTSNVVEMEIDTAKATRVQSRLADLVGEHGSVTVVPRSVDPSDPQMIAQRKLADLRAQRDQLLQEFLPEAPQVQVLTSEINTLEAHLKTPQTKKTVPFTRLRVTLK